MGWSSAAFCRKPYFRGGVDVSFDRAVALKPHAGRVGTVAKHEPKRSQQDGLAAARLSREDVKTRLEVELDVRNECVVPNFKPTHHQPKRWS